jgi:hypothetical protein
MAERMAERLVAQKEEQWAEKLGTLSVVTTAAQ